MKARLRVVGRWYPAGAAIVGAVSCWGLSSLLVLRIALTIWAVSYAVIFRSWRSAERRAEQLLARGDRGLPCPSCSHYACDGEQCASCEGACRAGRVISMPRPSVPRPRADWLN